MDNKVLVDLIVPEIGKSFDLYLPVNRKIGNIILLLNKSINELTNGDFPLFNTNGLFNVDTKELYNVDTLLINTNIRNGTRLVLISNQ